jgi:peptidoglycan/LPS O-acetylase OafA/YrhL
MTQFLVGLIGIALTIAIAKLSWQFFEKPLLRRGHAYKY